jgi:hypothetical protein
MIKALGILAIAAVIITIDVPPLIKTKQKRELYVFFTLLVTAVVVSLLMNFNVNIPNPLDFIKWMFKPMTNVLNNVQK